MHERLEGKQSILAALMARARRIDVILVSWNARPANTSEVLALAQKLGVPVKTAPPEELDSAARGKTHGGLVAICGPKPPATVKELLEGIKSSPAQPLLLMLEGVEDEQNLGFILRTAYALGAGGVLLKKHVWNFDPVAVSRASAGAYELLPLVKVEREAEALDELRKAGLKMWGAVAAARRTMYEVDFTGPVIVALGGEKRGLSAVVRGRCAGVFSIPMPARAVSSLALSHSAAIILAEAARQRVNSNTPCC